MRLIDADKAVEQINEWLHQTRAIPLDTSYYFELLGCVEDCPTIDAVPVVRCSECISHGTLKSGELFCGKIKTGIYGYYHTVKADDYCSYGERKGDRK
jgi:hypothetical protein